MDAQLNFETLALAKRSPHATDIAPAGRATAPPKAGSCIGGGGKRAIDVVLAAFGLAVLAIPMLIVAMLVRSTMGGPAIFRHVRIGFGGTPFECLKFRTMVADSEAALARHLAENPDAAEEWRTTRKLKDDPRVTWLGRALRMSSLDELPQLFNVLRGEMSCVGPRPIISDELELYGADAEQYLKARPGLTGLWQVSGRSSLSYPERVALDAAYVNAWSMKQDLEIMIRTVPAMLKSHQTS